MYWQMIILAIGSVKYYTDIIINEIFLFLLFQTFVIEYWHIDENLGE